jgi:hypothetical protein
MLCGLSRHDSQAFGAGAGSFERAARIVQPNVAAGNHLARDMDIIVLNKYKMAQQIRKLAEMNDMLDEAFAFIVFRMGLAGKDELDRTLRILDELCDVPELLKDKRRAFVGGKPAGKTIVKASVFRSRSNAMKPP